MRRMSSASIPVRRNSSTRRMGSPASWVRKEGGARRQSAASVANKLISEMINNLYKEGDMEKTSIELILSDGREGMLSVIMVLFSHALDHGDYLEKKKMDRKLFQHWAKQCKLITTDKEQSRYMTLVDWSVDSEGNLDIVRFTKVLVHIGRFFFFCYYIQYFKKTKKNSTTKKKKQHFKNIRIWMVNTDMLYKNYLKHT